MIEKPPADSDAQEIKDSCFFSTSSSIQISSYFNYIHANSIKRIMRDQRHNVTNIMFRNASAFSQDTEYMRRQYFYFNQSGKKQIENRLEMLGNFYSQACLMTFEFPLMVLTKHQHTFKRRLRKMRKMVACNDSSDDSESESMNFHSQSTVNLLKNRYFEKDITQRDFSSSNSTEKSFISFESSTHDIYENTDLIVENQIWDQSLVKVEEKDVQQWICDVRDVDYERTMEAYQIIESEQRERKQEFDSLSRLLKKPEFSETIINFRKPQKKIFEIQNFSLRDQTLTENSGRIERGEKRENENTYKIGKKQRKQKIREKAAALLKRVKSQSYINYKRYVPESQLNVPEEE